MKDPDRSESAGALLASLALKLLRLGYLACLLAVLQAVQYAYAWMPAILKRSALLGFLLCLTYEFVLRVPDFPFTRAIVLPISCVVLLSACKR